MSQSRHTLAARTRVFCHLGESAPMSQDLRRTDASAELLDIIRQVRQRWRVKLALRGALGVVGLGLAVLLLSAYGLESWRFTVGSIVAFRIVLAVAVMGLVAALLVRPLLRRPTDEQVALYLEEHEPSLQAAIISAIEASRPETEYVPTFAAEAPVNDKQASKRATEASLRSTSHSDALVRRLVASAVEKCHGIEEGRQVERIPMRRYATTLGAVAPDALLLFVFGPAYLRHALSALLIISRDVQAAAPYRIEVKPGNATVPRGADQTITAHLSGFDAEQASLLVRKSPEAAFERVPLVRGEGNQYEGMLFDLAGPVEYRVEAAGVHSDLLTLKVVDLPYVQRLELEYVFPSYTGLAPQKVEDGGDIAVLKGTEVRVRAVPTMKSTGGQLVVSDKPAGALTPGADGAMLGSFKVEQDGSYRLELDAPSGERVPASPQYTIAALRDRAPPVPRSKP